MGTQSLRVGQTTVDSVLLSLYTKDNGVSPAATNQILLGRTWRNYGLHLKVSNILMFPVIDKTYARGNQGTRTLHSHWCEVRQNVHSDEHNSVSELVSRLPYMGKVPIAFPCVVAELSHYRLIRIPGLLPQSLPNSSTGYLPEEYAEKPEIGKLKFYSLCGGYRFHALSVSKSLTLATVRSDGWSAPQHVIGMRCCGATVHT